MLNKTIPVFLSLLPLYASASGLALQNTSNATSLSALKENVLYELVCNITNNENSAVDIAFEPRLLSSARYGNVQLNHTKLTNNMGNLQQGDNRLTFNVLIEKKDTGNYNRFFITNPADTTTPQPLCVANEIKTNASAKSIGAPGAGVFFAYNDTSTPVTIGVGNFFPTEYYIEPNNWRTVWVSSDNQNIHIKKIH